MNDETARTQPLMWVDGQKVLYDRCVWCGGAEDMTESHIFPKSLKARLSPVASCRACNNYLGKAYEKEVGKNALLTAALVGLGLKPSSEVYRPLEKMDVDSGQIMRYNKQGVLEAKPHKSSDGRTVVGTLEQMKRIVAGEILRKDPEFPIEELMAFYDDPKRTVFSARGRKITQTTFDGGVSSIRIRGTRDPHPGLIFKIAYEVAAISGMISDDSRWATMASLRTINATSPDRIVFDQRMPLRAISNTAVLKMENKDLEKLPWRPFHSATMRVSRELNLFVEIWFFGVIKSLFLIGRAGQLDDWLALNVDKVIVVPADGSQPFIDQWQNLTYRNHTQWADTVMDVRARELTEAGVL